MSADMPITATGEARRPGSFDFTLVVLDDAGRPHLAESPEPAAAPVNPPPGPVPSPADRRSL